MTSQQAEELNKKTEMGMDSPKIQLGDYIIIQRQSYTKLQKFGSLDTTTMLGKEQIELRSILNQPYGSTFKMCRKECVDKSAPPKNTKNFFSTRLNTLELCTETDLRNIREVLGISLSGADNRDICDSGDSQNLRKEDIEQLRDECGAESTKIIEKIVENSKTFHAKTEYSQEKYLKKKERKYFEYVQIRQPTIRLITEIYYRQDADKIMGMRLDTLSQLLSYVGVNSAGNFLLYESGTNGLMPAACLNALGAKTAAKLVHMHPGNVPQKQAMLALNLPQEQLERCISVNIYSVLRDYYQAYVAAGGDGDGDSNAAAVVLENESLTAENEQQEPSNKKLKLAEENEAAPAQTVAKSATEANKSQTEKWQQQNKRACALLATKFDGLIIVAKEHPMSIVKSLLPFLKPSRPLVVFSQCRELLMELFVELKTTANVTNLHVSSNWLRTYQILPNRTHPEVNMNGNSGYLLRGYTVM